MPTPPPAPVPTAPPRPTAPPPRKHEALEDVCIEVVQRIVRDIGRDQPRGHIAKVVDDSEACVSLGTRDGTQAGDVLEIVRPASEPREVVGRMRVISVQEQLSRCALLTGRIEQKDIAGRLNDVLPEAYPARMNTWIAAVHIHSGAGIAEQALRSALSLAIARSERLELSQAADAEYQLDVRATAHEHGVSLDMELRSTRPDRLIAKATGHVKTCLSVEDMGYRSALEANLPGGWPLAVGEAALKDVFPVVRRVGDALFFQSDRAGTIVGWAFTDGKLVVAGRADLSTKGRSNALQATWHSAADAVAKRVIAVRDGNIGETFNSTVLFYTA